MGNVMADNEVVVHESTFAHRSIIIDVVEEGLSNEVEAVKVVQAFNICWEASSVFRVDLDLVMLESGLWTIAERDRKTSI